MEQPFVSVVITVLNMERTIGRCLDSIIAQDYAKDRYEIVIVDAGSRDRTLEIINGFIAKGSPPHISLHHRKGWPSAGRNGARKVVKGEFIAVTDADMEVSARWLSEYVDELRKLNDAKIGGIGGPNVTADLDLASRAVSCIPVHGPTFDEVPIFGKNRYTEGFVTSDFIYATVCRNSFYRKEALDSIDWFDERFFGAEDPELNCRLLEKGWKLAYTKKALVRHHHHSTVRAFFRQQRKYALWQAVANRLHPKMKSPLHSVPFLGFLGLVGLVAVALLFHPFIYLLLAAVALAFVGFMAYGLKCAIIKKDSGLFFAVPFFAFVWQVSWVLGYPAGLLQRDRLLAGPARPPEAVA